jgi:hypothetical protein
MLDALILHFLLEPWQQPLIKILCEILWKIPFFRATPSTEIDRDQANVR